MSRVERRVHPIAQLRNRRHHPGIEFLLYGDQALIEEGITMVTAYLERHATPEGLAGIAR